MSLRIVHPFLSTLAFGLMLLPPNSDAGVPAAVPVTFWQASGRSEAGANVQPVAEDAQRLFPLQGGWNARTFAGLQGAHGPIPANAFLRAADLSHLTSADLNALAAAGVELDIDLRTADEQQQSFDELADDVRFAYRRISLMGAETMDLRQMMLSLPDSLGEAYVQWLGTNPLQFKQVFQEIAAKKEGVVLFHCTAGKDRTGVIAGILLDLAGVRRADIIHDYAVSAHYLQGQPVDSVMNMQVRELIKQDPELATKMARMGGTAPEDMAVFLAALHEQYGGAAGFLRVIGLSDAEISSLRQRLGQAG